MMIPFLKNAYSISPLSSPQKALPVITVMASVRSGQANQPQETPFASALKQSSEHARKILKSVKEWLSVNHPDQALSDDQLLALLNGVQAENNRSAETVLKLIETKIPSIAATNSPYVDSLKQQVKEAITGGKTAVNKWLQAFVILQYVPSTIVTIMTTIWINQELEKAKKINKKEMKLLNNQEIARQLVGVLIHCVQASASFALVDGIALAGKQNNRVRQQAEQWATNTEGWQGLNKAVGKGLHTIADGLQWSWNTLHKGHNKTGLSLAFVMLSNLLSYGIMRPLLVNTTFLGINEATADSPPTALPSGNNLPPTHAISYAEQVLQDATIISYPSMIK
jgi:hypothetical protein